MHLFSQSRGKLKFDAERNVFIPGTSVQAERSAGACKGSETLAEAFADGFAAGSDATTKAGFKASSHQVSVAGVHEAKGGFLGAVPHPHDAGRVKAFVDFQNDVTAKDRDEQRRRRTDRHPDVRRSTGNKDQQLGSNKHL